MSRFLLQSVPIDGIEFYLIPVDTHLGIIKIPTDETIDDYEINTIGVMLIGTDINQVLNSLQKGLLESLMIMENLRNQK